MDTVFMVKSDLDLAIYWLDKNEIEKAREAIFGAMDSLIRVPESGSLDSTVDEIREVSCCNCGAVIGVATGNFEPEELDTLCNWCKTSAK